MTYLGTWVYEKHPKTGKLIRVRKININYSKMEHLRRARIGYSYNRRKRAMDEMEVQFRQYVKKELSSIEATPWTDEFDMSRLSSKPKEPPKEGDMIARSPKDRDDMWLISKEYFEENYEEMDLDI